MITTYASIELLLILLTTFVGFPSILKNYCSSYKTRSVIENLHISYQVQRTLKSVFLPKFNFCLKK